MTLVSNNRHSERATLALRALAEKDPCFASLSLFCHHRDRDEDFAPAWTNGKTIFYAKAFEDWKQPQQVAVCAHEIMHIAFCHIQRGKRLRQRFGLHYRQRLFNIVTDAIINETLRSANYRVPKEGVFLCELLKFAFGETVTAAETLSKWDAESLYIRIDTYEDGVAALGCDRCCCSSLHERDQSATASNNGDVSIAHPNASSELCDTCGKPLLPTAIAATYAYAKSKGYVDDMDTSSAVAPLSPEDEQEEAKWRERTLRAFATSRDAGRGVGTLGHHIADLPKSITPWETILRAALRKAVSKKRMTTFSKPTRRWLAMDSDARARDLHQPAYEPSINAARYVPRVVVGIDVSGSISDLLLRKFAAEIVGIGKRTGAEIHVMVFDTAVISHTKMKDGDWHNQITGIDFARGGGTDFHDVLEKAQELQPSIITILTDLLGPMGEPPGQVPVLWACPDADAPSPKFGKVINLAS